MKRIVFVLVLMFFLVGCSTPLEESLSSDVSLPFSSDIQSKDTLSSVSNTWSTTEHSVQTSDGKEIFFDYFANNKTKNAVVLVHMLNGDKTDWNTFSRILRSQGFGVAQLDLRGHGKSQGDWRDFSSSDFLAMTLDVDVVVEFLHAMGYEDISYVGASIGANTVLRAAPPGSSVVLLSPGLDYRSVSIEETMKNFNGSVLIVASSEDTYSAQSSKSLAADCTDCELVMLENANHGTRMLENNASLEAVLLEFLQS